MRTRNGLGTAEAPWQLKTPPGTAEYQAYRPRFAPSIGEPNWQMTEVESAG